MPHLTQSIIIALITCKMAKYLRLDNLDCSQKSPRHKQEYNHYAILNPVMAKTLPYQELKYSHHRFKLQSCPQYYTQYRFHIQSTLFKSIVFKENLMGIYSSGYLDMQCQDRRQKKVKCTERKIMVCPACIY